MIRATFTALALAICLAAPTSPAQAQAQVNAVEVTSAQGLNAWLVEAPDIPFIALELRFPGGVSLDTAQTSGAVALMTALLEEGAGDMSAQAFATARDDLAASYRFDAGRDEVTVSARILTENRDAAVDLLRLALLEPRFDADAVARVRAQIASSIRSDARDPDTLAGRKFAQLAYGDHPYARPAYGTEETLARITPEDLRRAHRDALVRDRVQVSVVGDITKADLGPLLDRLLGDLPASATPLPGPANVALVAGITHLPFPGPQSTIVFGQPAFGPEDPDFFAAYLVTEIFGGGRFSARLMSEVREKRGLTYGIGAGLAPMDHATTFQGRVQTANETTTEVIEIIRTLWAQIRAEGVTEAELASVKTYLTGAYPLRFDGNGAIARVLSGMQAQGYPIDYPDTRNARINAVTLEDANRVAARLFAPDALHFVVVGAAPQL